MHAILVHGFRSWPENAWFPWLRRELEARGWTTESLRMPNPEIPKRTEWIKMIEGSIRSPDTVLIGHSLGCLALLWTLEKHSGPPVAGCVLVSGFGRDFHAKGLHTWFPRDVDFEKVKKNCLQWKVLHARLDDTVPYREGQWLATQLGVPLITPVLTGHLTEADKIVEVPEILEAVLSCSHAT